MTARRQAFRGGVAGGSQPRRRRDERLPKLGLGGSQALAFALLVLEPLELRGRGGTEVDHRLERVPVLASQVVEQAEALLRRLARRGVEIHRVGRGGRVARQLGGLRRQPRGSIRERLEPGVQLRCRGELALGDGEPFGGRVVLSQRSDRRGGGSCDRFGVGGGAQLCLELRVLAGARRGSGDLIGLVTEELNATCQLVRIGQKLGRGDHAGAPGAVGIGDGLHQGGVTAEAVEQAQLARWLEESLLIVLAVDLREAGPERREAADRDRAVVQAHGRTTVGSDLPTHDDRPLARLDQVRQRVVVGRGRSVEDRLDAGGIGPGADLVGGGARAERECDGVDDQRLAGAGLAGEHREARREGEPHRLDHGEVLDGQLAKGHGVSIGLSRAAARPSCAAGRRTGCCRSAGSGASARAGRAPRRDRRSASAGRPGRRG